MLNFNAVEYMSSYIEYISRNARSGRFSTCI